MMGALASGRVVFAFPQYSLFANLMDSRRFSKLNMDTLREKRVLKPEGQAKKRTKQTQ